MIDTLLFAIFPYVALGLALSVGIYRYFFDRFSFSSRSSQFLESRQLFWGSVPWHYGLLVVLLAHLLAALFPGAWAALLGEPLRLYFLEATGLGFGTLTLAGIGLLVVRRLGDKRVSAVTSPLDWVLLGALLAQVLSGVHIALFYRWGSFWYLTNAVPWLWSLARLDPQLAYIAALPWPIKLHFFNAFLLVAVFPFTKLVHIFTAPITYLWRPYQVVIWHRAGGPHSTPRVPRREVSPQALPADEKRPVPLATTVLVLSVMLVALVAGGLFSTGAWLYQSRGLTTSPVVEPLGTSDSSVVKPPTPARAEPTLPVPAGGDVAAGQGVFRQFCDGCHPGGGQGVGPALRVADLKAKYPDDEALRKVITDGVGTMPGFAQLSAAQLDQLVAYIWTLD